ncbi:MAG: NAD(P)H-dependent oxidoreductase [Phaeodactylibacter sp.]|nr:NAD(P)H-dependent oxidoreductase [Phaeodactylibacter sp.]
MITIISSTNRKESGALLFSQIYASILKELTDQDIKVLALEDIPHDWFTPTMYDKGGQPATIHKLQDEYLLPADKFVFVIPEYNGSFPGVLKLFLDACSVREYKKTFKGKKAALVGIATGRAGNLRGMEHFTGVLNHVGTIVLPNRLPISSIEKLINEQEELIDEPTREVITSQMREFIAF